MTLGLILAAGASRRMGHPKALTRIQGMPAWERIRSVLADCGASPVRIVLGEDAPRILAEGGFADVEVVVNRSPDRGRTGSIHCGLKGWEGDLLLWPVDHPMVRKETILALLGAGRPDVVATPLHQGEGGHPLWVSETLLEGILSLPEDTPLGEWVACQRRVRVAVDDPAILLNLDSPASLP